MSDPAASIRTSDRSTNILLDVIPVRSHLERSPLHARDQLTDRGIELASGTARPLDPPRQVRLDRRVKVAAIQGGALRDRRVPKR
jgi:hypothetical protein